MSECKTSPRSPSSSLHIPFPQSPRSELDQLQKREPASPRANEDVPLNALQPPRPAHPAEAAPQEDEAVRNWFSELLCDTASVLKGTLLTGITGAGTGLALGGLTLDPEIAAYTSAAFGSLAAIGHMLKRAAAVDGDGKPKGPLNDTSDFILASEGLVFDTACAGAA